jgi:two-component system cell cycle response regulator CpdR
VNEFLAKGERTSAMKIGNSSQAPRILHADDEPMICRTVARVLERAGYTVVTANDGPKAWEALKTDPFDLLITDDEMPHLRGVELVLKVRQHGLNLPVTIASSPFEFFAILGKGCLHTAQMLPKPFSSQELIEAVESCLHAQRIHGRTRCIATETKAEPVPLSRELFWPRLH